MFHKCVTMPEGKKRARVKTDESEVAEDRDGVKRREKRDVLKMEEGEVRVQRGRNETYQNPISTSFNTGGKTRGQGCIID